MVSTLRVMAEDSLSAQQPCCRCGATGGPWDRIGRQPFCPDCQEALVQGTVEPLIVRAEQGSCAVCARHGTLSFLTFPLGLTEALLMDLCPEHFRALLGRRLERCDFQHLRQELARLGLEPGQIFLLHEAFYDNQGRALQPAHEVD